MNLSDRLKEVISLVPKCGTVADIGCDHAYVAIELVNNGTAQKVIACDVNKGPLVIASSNVVKAGLEDRIMIRQSDGFSALQRDEADAVIIAGMGGRLMMNIILNGLDKITGKTALILQPQSDICSFRHFLYDNGFVADAESMIYEDGKYYPMMRAHIDDGRMREDEMTDIDFAYGKLLLDGRDTVLRDYLMYEEKQLDKIMSELDSGKGTQRAEDRYKEIKEQVALNKKALGRYV